MGKSTAFGYARKPAGRMPLRRVWALCWAANLLFPFAILIAAGIIGNGKIVAGTFGPHSFPVWLLAVLFICNSATLVVHLRKDQPRRNP